MTPAVPRLIHLNGPPGWQVNTGQMYADAWGAQPRHSSLRALIGGWRDRFAETGATVRPLAFSMAAAHLTGGMSSCRNTWASWPR
jgi:hypothetical protein